MTAKMTTKRNAQYVNRLNHYWFLKKRLQYLIGDKDDFIYGEPAWKYSDLLVGYWNNQLDKMAREFPEFRKQIQKIRGYRPLDWPLDKPILFDQIGRDEEGKLYCYVVNGRTITVRELYENREMCEAHGNSYEEWSELIDHRKCSYANRSWPWITYQLFQYQHTVPQMESQMRNLIEEVEKETVRIKKKLER